MAQIFQFDAKVSSHLRSFCSHRITFKNDMHYINPHFTYLLSLCFEQDDGTIKITVVII